MGISDRVLRLLFLYTLYFPTRKFSTLDTSVFTDERTIIGMTISMSGMHVYLQYK